MQPQYLYEWSEPEIKKTKKDGFFFHPKIKVLTL